jgi:hypothetical protein
MGAVAATPNRHKPDRKRALFEASGLNAPLTAISTDDDPHIPCFVALPSIG